MRVLDGCLAGAKGLPMGLKLPLGYQPTVNDLNRAGLQITEDEVKGLLEVNAEDCERENPLTGEFFKLVGDGSPKR